MQIWVLVTQWVTAASLFHFSQPGVQFSSRQQPPHPTIVGTGQAQTPGHHQPVFGASPMGLLPAGGVRGGGGGQGDQVGAAGQLAHLTGEKKPPLLSHKLSGAEMTAVRQLITGYRFLENKSLSLFNLTPHFPGNRRLFFWDLPTSLSISCRFSLSSKVVGSITKKGNLSPVADAGEESDRKSNEALTSYLSRDIERSKRAGLPPKIFSVSNFRWSPVLKLTSHLQT